MKTSIVTILLSAAMVSAIPSTSAVTAPDEAPGVQAPSGLSLSVGGTASLVLPGNPTTGYTWSLAEPLAEDSPVTVSFDTTAPKKKDGGMPVCGAPQDTVVTFTGLREGTAVIRLVYIRPWEKGKPPVNSRTIHVTVGQ